MILILLKHSLKSWQIFTEGVLTEFSTKPQKQTDVINLLKLGEFLELSLEELLIYYLKG